LALFGSARLAERFLGDTVDYLGGGLKDFTERRVNNLKDVIENAAGKLPPGELDRPGTVPPRVLKGVLEEGQFADSALAVDYLGGVLASARTETGRDDRGASLTALIGRLSAYQLRTHYAFYAAARPVLVGSDLNLGMQTQRQARAQFFMDWQVWATAMDLTAEEANSFTSIFRHTINGLIREQLLDDFYASGNVEHLRSSCMNRDFAQSGIVYELSPLGAELFGAAAGKQGDPYGFFLAPDESFTIPGIEVGVAVQLCSMGFYQPPPVPPAVPPAQIVN
jgi:hypothetical protein